MNLIFYKLRKSILFLSFLNFTLISCAQPNPSTQEDQAPEVSKPSPFRLTNAYLKFTKGVRAIFEDSQGRIWIGSHEEGLALLKDGEVAYFDVDNGLSSNQVRSIYEDALGDVWIEGGEGVSSYSSLNFGLMAKQSERKYDAVNEWKLTGQDLWFKADGFQGFNEQEGHPGVYQYDGQNFSFRRFPIQVKKGEEGYYSMTTPFVPSKKGGVWFGTYGAAIGFDGKNFTIIDSDYVGLSKATGFLHIRSLMEDRQGNLWIGNNGIGVLKYDGKNIINFSEKQGLVPKDSQHNGSKSPPGTLEHVFAIAEDRQGNIWFGDRDTGAWKFDGKSLQNYTTKDGLTTTHIWQIYQTKMGELWFAMGDGAVCRFNGTSFERIL